MAQNSLTPYQYIWRDYSQPLYQNLILTLNSYQALSLLAFVSAYIAYAQTRWWIITRYLLIRVLRPIQLLDSDGGISLHHLSQAKAIKLLIFKEKRQSNDSMTSISPWFGAASLFNILLFVVLGTIIPYYLTGGSGPAQVQSEPTDACDGFRAYSDDAMQLAKNFYTQCRFNTSTDESTCGYVTRMADSQPQLNFTLDVQCPFAEGNCVGFGPKRWKVTDDDRMSYAYNKALKIAYLDMQPSDYGLNIDSRIRQSHSLTCAPLGVSWFRVPYGTPRGGNVTVFWIGYTPGNFNKSEKYTGVGETAGSYYPPPLIRDGPFKLESAMVYELVIYPGYVDNQRGWMYENFHPGLKSDDGDMFIVMFKYGAGFSSGTPSYSPYVEGLRDPLIASNGAMTYALGCFEQYQLCFDEKCVGWSNATEATSKMFQFLKSNYDHEMASEVTKVQSLLIQATSLRNFMFHHHRSRMMVHSMLPKFETIFKNSPKKQWHWEVQSWFEISFLTAKFSFLASVQGVKGSSLLGDNFSNTSWICNRLLFLDDSHTNINFIGLIATLSGLLALYLISAIGTIFVLVKQGLKICKRVCWWAGAVFKRLWEDLLHDLALAYNWVQTEYKLEAGKIKAVFQAMGGGVGLLAGILLINRRSSARRSWNSDYDDEGIPSNPSINLEGLGRSN